MGIVGLSTGAATAAALLAAAGCAAGPDRPATVDQITPMAAYNDVPLSAIVYGTSFRPIYDFDPVSGRANVEVDGFSAWLVGVLSVAGRTGGPEPRVPLSQVVWEAGNMVTALLPAGIAPGVYDLVVRDPRGQTSQLPNAFTSLGPDQDPPRVTIVSPAADGIVGALASVAVVVQVSDGLGQVVGLEVKVRTATETILPYDCSAAAQAKTACTFSFVAPAPAANPSVLFIDATAVDGGGNRGTVETMLQLVPAPVATSLSPSKGATLGGTTVTVLGANFQPLATDVLFDGASGGPPSAQSSTSVTVSTPPHVAGQVEVTVRVGGSGVTVPGGFVYVDPPIVRAISPNYGPPSGGTAVRVVGDNFDQNTRILVGPFPLVSVVFYNANLIEGITPAGSGSVAIGAYDPVLDVTTSGSAVFNYGNDGVVPDGGLPIPCLIDAGCSGNSP